MAMIDKRGTIGKMIDTKRVVWECLFCGIRIIAEEKPYICPRCKDHQEFVINGNLLVTK